MSGYFAVVQQGQGIAGQKQRVVMRNVMQQLLQYGLNFSGQDCRERLWFGFGPGRKNLSVDFTPVGDGEHDHGRRLLERRDGISEDFKRSCRGNRAVERLR
jgi:hypothetical protein